MCDELPRNIFGGVFLISQAVDCWLQSELSLGLCQTPVIEIFCENSMQLKPLTIVTKSSIIDVWCAPSKLAENIFCKYAERRFQWDYLVKEPY